MSRERPVRGERYVWDDAVIVDIRRVAPDGTWVDLLCADGITIWHKRMPLPLPDTFELLEVDS